MKKEHKIYLEQDDYDRLKLKAEERNLNGRGWLSQFIRMISREQFIFLNQDTKALLKMLKFKIGL